MLSARQLLLGNARQGTGAAKSMRMSFYKKCSFSVTGDYANKFFGFTVLFVSVSDSTVNYDLRQKCTLVLRHMRLMQRSGC